MTLPSTGHADLEWRGEALHYRGLPVKELAERTGTPAFVYAAKRVTDNAARLARALAPPPPLRLDVAYSVKTSCEPRLLTLLASLGLGAEVGCEHELRLALAAGFPPDRVLLDGPVHEPSALEAAASCGIRAVKVDSLDQLSEVAAAARECGKLGVLLRLAVRRPPWNGSPAEGLAGRFGLGSGQIRAALGRVASEPRLEFLGLAIHIGSQVSDAGAHAQGMEALLDGAALAADHGLVCRVLDLGGGYPSPSLGRASLRGLLGGILTGDAGHAPSPERIGRAIHGVLRRRVSPAGLEALVVEPGRALVGDAAILLTRVRAVKPGWVFLDASRNFVPESPLFAARRFLPAAPSRGVRWLPTRIAGRTLSGSDVLALRARLPRVDRGDLLVMLDAGAYTLSRACRFTTLIPAVFLLHEDKSLDILRREETPEDVVAETQPR
jgi:diaminopimelate decarboxylase